MIIGTPLADEASPSLAGVKISAAALMMRRSGRLKGLIKGFELALNCPKGSRGHSQGPKQTNVSVTSRSHPCTCALANT